jgi:uncharacterized low-complexity protein
MEAFPMSQVSTKKPLSIALGAAFATSLAAAPVANAADNPFAMSELSSGYMVAEMAEGKCGEGKCGGDKAKTTATEGADKTMGEGKCGEGKCGGDKAKTMATEGADKAMGEGKCGEGKCGANK